MSSIRFLFAAGLLACVVLALTAARAVNDTTHFPVDTWEPPFNQLRQHVRKEYTPLTHATKPWRLCASIPHLKDNYWLAVNFALVQEAQRLGVRLNLFEAGGNEHLQTQRDQIAECIGNGANGLIVGAISAEGLNEPLALY